MNKNLTWHSIVLGLILIVGSLGFAACDILNQTTTINEPDPVVTPTPVPTPTPTPAATPTPGASQIRSVQVNRFGGQSGANCTPSCPADATPCRTLPRGCTMALTCTAITTDGRDAGNVIPGLSPSYFGPKSNTTAVTVTPHVSNPLWNLDVTGVSNAPPNQVEFTCTVGGVSTPSDPSQAYILTVLP